MPAMMSGERLLAGDGWFVLVTGWPGSGKSTLAAALGPPLLAKDEIKEALMDALGCRRQWATHSD